MNSPARLVLVVEDEIAIAGIITAYLERNGYRVVRAGDGVAAIQHCRTLAPDLVILDIGLPRRDGLQVLDAIRADGATPVILVTARSSDTDKIAGLRGGADDYIVKPFNPVELVARVEAVLRRSDGSVQRKRLLRHGNLTLDPEAAMLTVTKLEGEQSLSVSATQLRLLAALMEAAPRVLSRQALIEKCLGEGEALERTVDSHLSKLRRRLADSGATCLPEAVRGHGYRLVQT